MRFHVVSLPHTELTNEFSACAYTSKVRGFCRMMRARGHVVVGYGGEETDEPFDEYVVIATREEQQRHVGKQHYTEAPYEGTLWNLANQRAARAIRERKQERDFLCLIAGIAQKPIADALPELIAVEFGVGYGGTFSKYRVFESYAWMHTVYGAQAGNPHAADGNWWDAVIPGYLDEKEFPLGDGRGDERGEYLLYVGRLIDRKGWGIAREVAQALGKRLVVAGPGTPTADVEYRGIVGPRERSSLMREALAVMVPTIYVEPFANVHVEAMTSGTPVITTDWGVFTETVEENVTGFRCRNFKEFCNAAEKARTLDREVIRQRAVARFSLAVVGKKYEEYFERIASLWEKGWYQ